MNFKDTADMALTGEYLSRLLDEYLDEIFKANPQLKKPTDADVARIRKKVLEELKKKYPTAGIIDDSREDK